MEPGNIYELLRAIEQTVGSELSHAELVEFVDAAEPPGEATQGK
ncbi:hypothetical protein [Arthrobacter sp. KK5.5]